MTGDQRRGLAPGGQTETSPRCALTDGSVLDRLYSAHGQTDGEPDMRWTVDQSAHVLEVDTGMKMLRLNRAEALALLECINAGLPHMALNAAP